LWIARNFTFIRILKNRYPRADPIKPSHQVFQALGEHDELTIEELVLLTGLSMLAKIAVTQLPESGFVELDYIKVGPPMYLTLKRLFI